MEQIAVDDWEGGHYSVVVDKKPDQCGICHHGVELIYKMGVIAAPLSVKTSDNYVQAVFVCPRRECRRVLIAYYTAFAVERDNKSPLGPTFKLQGIKPWSFRGKEFPDTIKAVSPLFCRIYNESAQAEGLKLSNIAGPGYRKALEFLVKDYLISECPAEDEDAKDAIEKTQLGRLIKKKIPDGNLNQCLERAAWIGNDETHYWRQWLDKDIRDLKRLIDLCVIWMESDLLTKQYLKDMPPPEKKGALV